MLFFTSISDAATGAFVGAVFLNEESCYEAERKAVSLVWAKPGAGVMFERVEAMTMAVPAGVSIPRAAYGRLLSADELLACGDAPAAWMFYMIEKNGSLECVDLADTAKQGESNGSRQIDQEQDRQNKRYVH